MKPDKSISDVMKSAKAKSSKWINENKFLHKRFEWQSGFGAFSYNNKEISSIINYIKLQEEHHKKFTFSEEYLKFLKENEVNSEDSYIFKNPE